MKRISNWQENLICLIAGLYLAIYILSILLGESDKGLLDLF